MSSVPLLKTVTMRADRTRDRGLQSLILPHPKPENTGMTLSLWCPAMCGSSLNVAIQLCVHPKSFDIAYREYSILAFFQPVLENTGKNALNLQASIAERGGPRQVPPLDLTRASRPGQIAGIFRAHKFSMITERKTPLLRVDHTIVSLLRYFLD